MPVPDAQPNAHPDAPRLKRATKAAPVGIVHFGPGAFFRAFNAAFTHDAMHASGGDWGIAAVSLRSSDARDALAPQGGCFTAISRAPAGPEHRVISAISEVLVAPEDPSEVIARMADPKVRIVSLTITEKGYCHLPDTGDMDPAHPDIRHDLANLTQPRSAIGFLVAGLAARRVAGCAPFTILSCDNLPANGALVRRVVLAFARAVDPSLADWIANEARFPSTMVDRITPATTAQDIADLTESAGYHDPACVVHEPFRQWVIEDDFVTGHPDWATAGAQFVADVDAHEVMKLRCLNGTHSALAYLGYLAGHETIADAVAAPEFTALCETLWRDEILTTVPQPEGEDLPAYVAQLMARYRNPEIRHKTWQIAMDGSQKLPQRLLAPIASHLARGQVPLGLSLVVAGWMHYVGGDGGDGQAIDVLDPLAKQLRAASEGAKDTRSRVAALMHVGDIFPDALRAHAGFVAALEQALKQLETEGARAAVRAHTAGA